MERLPPLVLAYHGVADVSLRHDPYGLFVRPQDLEGHIAALRRWGYAFAPFGELAAHVAAGTAAGRVSLTFDDGFVDNLDRLVPLLRRHGIPATVFVVSGWLGRAHPHATWTRIMREDELRSLAAEGVEVGAHTVSHADLTTLSRQAARAELEQSRFALEELTGQPVEVAAYPYGRATAQTRESCREAGFHAACRTSGNGHWSDPLDLPRQDMHNGCTRMGLALKREGRYEPLMSWRAARAGRRVVRLGRRFTR